MPDMLTGLFGEPSADEPGLEGRGLLLATPLGAAVVSDASGKLC